MTTIIKTDDFLEPYPSTRSGLQDVSPVPCPLPTVPGALGGGAAEVTLRGGPRLWLGDCLCLSVLICQIGDGTS